MSGSGEEVEKLLGLTGCESQETVVLRGWEITHPQWLGKAWAPPALGIVDL